MCNVQKFFPVKRNALKLLKLCPGCGSLDVRHLKASRVVECNNCGESLREEVWQSDSPREKVLFARIEAARELITALDEYSHRVAHPADYYFDKDWHYAVFMAGEKVQAARAKWEATE